MSILGKCQELVRYVVKPLEMMKKFRNVQKAEMAEK